MTKNSCAHKLSDRLFPKLAKLAQLAFLFFNLSQIIFWLCDKSVC